MESVYGMWIKEMRDRQKTSDTAELCQGLQTALGTAKWQVCYLFSASVFKLTLITVRTLAFARYHYLLSIFRKFEALGILLLF